MREILRIVFLMAFTFLFLVGRGQVIYTVAGGNKIWTNMPAITAYLSYPAGLIKDKSGNIYLAEYGTGTIKKIDTAGIITIVVGNGRNGFSGDGGPATMAQLSYPTDVALDSIGNLYIADFLNHRIRKVNNSTGIITTIAGTGSAGFGGDGGSATSAQLNYPRNIVLDKFGNILFTDMNNNRVRKINTSNIISTIAGNGSVNFSGDRGPATAAGLLSPDGLAIDKQGNLFVADNGNNRIRKINTAGIINTVAGNGGFGFSGDGGPALSAQLYGPGNITIDSLGDFYFFSNNRVRKVTVDGLINTVAGTGDNGFSPDGANPLAAGLGYIAGLYVDAKNNLLYSDQGNHRVRKIDSVGMLSTVAGYGDIGLLVGDNGSATSAQLYGPTGIVFDNKGNLYIADASNSRVRKIDLLGNITTVAGNGIAGYAGDGGLATEAKLSVPNSIAVDKTGNVYIAERYNGSRIRKIDANGIINTVAGNGTQGYSGDGGSATAAQLSSASSVAADSLGNLYISDNGNYCIRKVDNSGIITTIAGNGTYGFSGDGGMATSAQLSGANGIAIDKVGNLYIAETGRLRKIDVNNIITTVAGTGASGYIGDGGPAILAQFQSIGQLTTDSYGYVYLADQYNNRIRKIDMLGIVTTVAGIGTSAYGGDGGLPTLAQLNLPSSIAIDSLGNIYIADAGNNRIRKICITAQPATTKTADSSNTTTIFDVNNTIALHNGCDAIANLMPNGSNPVLGLVNSQVWLDATQNTGYVKRHYQITPSVNPTTSTATVTLFFTQTDFDGFNAVNSVKLPQNPTDAAGKANFKIEKRSGVSFDATGSPSSYNGTVVIIDPDDSNIVWNNTLARWEVTFNVTGFSGFFAKTSAAILPVTWLSVNGKLTNNGSAEINWLVEEQQVADYAVQKSVDGSNFQTIGTVGSVGNGQHGYRFTENQPLNGKAIYRIKQTDVDGQVAFSQAVYLGTIGKTMVYPNPVTSTTTLFSSAEMLGSKALLYDLQGKLLQQISIQQNVQTIHLSAVATGVYLLKLANGQIVKLVKE